MWLAVADLLLGILLRGSSAPVSKDPTDFDLSVEVCTRPSAVTRLALKKWLGSQRQLPRSRLRSKVVIILVESPLESSEPSGISSPEGAIPNSSPSWARAVADGPSP